MPSSYRAEQFAAFGLPIPPDAAFHVDVNERELSIMLLYAVSSLIGGLSGAPGIVVTPSIVTAGAGAGTVAAGARKVDFVLSPDFAGTILGVAYAGANDSAVSFEAPFGATLSSIDYTVSAGSIRIQKLV